MVIDCDTYLILARSGHPCEYTTHDRDHAVGLTAAKRVARQLRGKHPRATVEIFVCEPTGARIRVAG